MWGRGSLGPGGGVGVVLWVFVSIPKAGSACLFHSGSQSSYILILAKILESLELRVGHKGLGTPAPAARAGLVGSVSPLILFPKVMFVRSHLCMSEFVLHLPLNYFTMTTFSIFLPTPQSL